MDQLFVNGSYRPMARYPNFDSTAVRFNGTSVQATSIERIKKWKAPQEGYLHVMHTSDWGDVHYQIIGKDKNKTDQRSSYHLRRIHMKDTEYQTGY